MDQLDTPAGAAGTTDTEDLIVESTTVESIPVHPGAAVIDEAAKGTVDSPDPDKNPAGAKEAAIKLESAADFLLTAFDNGGVRVLHRMRLNVGTPLHKKWVPWVVTNVNGRTLRKIKAAADEAAQRKPGALLMGDADSNFEANCKVVVEGSVEPNIKELARERGIADPLAFLQMALEGKDGLVDQIAGQIYGISGYDNSDVQDAQEVAAVPNS